MKLLLHLFFIVSLILSSKGLEGQTVILDFESEATSTTFQYFGSSLDGSLTTIVDNPDMSGENTSDMVLEFIKPAGAQTWAGAFTNPDPVTNIDFSTHSNICIKVWMPRPGNVALKLEGSISGGDNWVRSAETTEANTWVELCYDPSLPSDEAPFTTASGHIYTKIVLFTYFGQAGIDADETVYIDDIVTHPFVLSSTVILDFEEAETSTNFQYFGSSLDGQLTTIIDNPDPSGINTSAMVLSYIKPAGAQTWAGAFSNPNPSIPVDATQPGEICVKVWSAGVGNLAVKLENSPTGDNWVTTQPITETDQWVELCFNFSEASIEAPFTPAQGHLYQTIVIFFDFGTPGGDEDQTYYLDDMIVNSGGASAANVSFKVNLSDLGTINDPVYLIGNFNDWSQSLPMNDLGDGIYEVTTTLDNGVYEYKYMVGDSVHVEAFGGLDECTNIAGEFEITNRRIVVAGNTDLEPVCFNSCYNCGEAIQISVNLGFGDTEVDDSGVYIAGGQAFDLPGGRFRLTDDNGDGVYSISFERAIGFTSYYTFTNGACPDYSCKEMIEGQSCANPNNFNDRLMGPLTSDTEFNLCFGLCVDNTDCTPTSTNEYTDLDDFLLSPTLSNSSVILKRGETYHGDLIITLYGIQGQIIDQQIMNANEEFKEMNVSILTNGLYFMVLKTNQGTRTLKFIKQ